MKTCAFITLGCKVNQYETQAVREAVLETGYTEVPNSNSADLYVINTCTVTSISDSKSKQLIRKVKRLNPNAKVVVTGCYAEANKDALMEMKGVDIVAGQDKKADIARILGNSTYSDSEKSSGSIFDLSISRFEDHTRAFIKIEDGCDNQCSYCIVPSVRGSVKSRYIKDIKSEAERLTKNGYHEIVLTGIHLGAYGKDFNKLKGSAEDFSVNLINVLKDLEKISGLKRIRLSSIEANEVTDDLISLITDSDKICPHFHLPLQSGDDYILKRMNRRYTSSKFISILNKIRDKVKYPSFTTDLIIGFPGEESVHFENSVKICREAGFSRIHIFPFSVRSGTAAAKMQDQCNPIVIKERKKIMQEVAHDLTIKYNENFINQNLEVLVESSRDKESAMLCGYTERYVKVLFNGDSAEMNKMVQVMAKEVEKGAIFGELSKQ